MTALGNRAIPTAHTHVENVLLDLLRRCLNLLLHILDYQLVLLNVRYQQWILL